MKVKDLKKGDACFSASIGETQIAIKTDTILFTIHQESFMLNGKKHTSDRHPTLFTSRDELLNYWKNERNK